MEFNIDNWKWFRYDDIFKIEKGIRLTTFDMEEGTIPYIASGSFDNGIVSYINNGITHNKGCITFACYGSIGECFYHDYDIWASDNVNVITLKDKIMNKYIGMFLISLFDKEKYRFSYGLTAKIARLNNFKIKLPATNTQTPDWDFIENYVKTDVIQQLPSFAKAVWTNTYDIIPINKNKITLNVDNWKWFRLDEIFNIEKGERLVQSERVKGDTALITATSENNGVVDYISFHEFINAKKCFENKITMDMFCNVFYHNYKFFSDDNVHTLIPKYKNNNVFISLFLVTILQKLKYKYKYGRQLRLSKLKYDKIKLPVSSEGAPDWEFMEIYIKSLPYSKSI